LPQANRLAILIVALIGHLVFVAPGSAAVPFHAEGADCCDTDCCDPDGRCADRTDPGDTPEDDCCPNGCDHCPLPCCGNGAALLDASAIAPLVPPAATDLVSAVEISASGSDPRGIYHPPRS